MGEISVPTYRINLDDCPLHPIDKDITEDSVSSNTPINHVLIDKERFQTN
jgi:hypothetical protein